METNGPPGTLRFPPLVSYGDSPEVRHRARFFSPPLQRQKRAPSLWRIERPPLFFFSIVSVKTSLPITRAKLAPDFF